MNSDKFIAFLEKRHHDAGRAIIVIADTASYHTSDKTRQLVQASKSTIALAPLARYAPELSPDKQVWNDAKKRLGQKLIESKEEMKRLALDILRRIQRSTSLVRTFLPLRGDKIGGCFLIVSIRFYAGTYATISVA